MSGVQRIADIVSLMIWKENLTEPNQSLLPGLICPLINTKAIVSKPSGRYHMSLPPFFPTMTIKSFWWAQRPVVAVSGVNISSLSPTQFLKLHSLIRRICRELDCDSENVLGLEGIKQ
jgi:hypothetical protein